MAPPFTENGWPSCGSDKLNRSFVPGTDIVIPLQDGIPNTIMKAFAAAFHAFVESLYNSRGGTDEGGWTPTNSVATSNHLGGTAMDLNWDDHPFQVLNAGFTLAKIAVIRELLAFFTIDGIQLIWWGNDWDDPKDAMHFQMGYHTYDHQDVCLKFINKFIRPDGFSTFRRGAVQPGTPRKLVIPDAGGTTWCDVSEYQKTPIGSDYPYEVFSFRTNSGDKEDKLARENAKRALELLENGGLQIVIPYYFFRPGQANCDLHKEVLEASGLWNHPRTVTMVDVEGDAGSVSGDNSWEINDEINRLRGWYSNFSRVIGYLNSNADPGIWLTRGGINLVVPQYGRIPGDISTIRDSQVKIDAIAHQYTSSGNVASWNPVDMNWSPYSVDELLLLLEMKEGPQLPSQDQMIRDIWDKMCAYPEDSNIAGKWPSRALFADSDKGIDDTVGMSLNTDGNVWDVWTLLGAMAGVSSSIDRIKRLAAGQGPRGKDPNAVQTAKELLRFIQEGPEGE